MSRAIDAALLKRAGCALLATAAGLGLAAAPGLVRAQTITVDSLLDNATGGG